MKDLLLYIVKSITKSDAHIEEIIDENHITFDIKLNPEVIGIVIGKSGNTINSIRNLLKVMAVLEKKSVSITISEA